MNPLRPRRLQAVDDYRDDTRVQIARPLWSTVAWRWRYEAVLVAVLSAVIVESMRHLIVAVLASLAPGTVYAVPAARRAVVARARCVVVAHRVRVACVSALLVSYTGRLPAILRVAPTPQGERVEIWCPPGLSPDDFVSARPQLAAACWVSDVRVSHRIDRAHRVVLEVVRRGSAVPVDDPLDPAPWRRPAVVRLPDAIHHRELER